MIDGPMVKEKRLLRVCSKNGHIARAEISDPAVWERQMTRPSPDTLRWFSLLAATALVSVLFLDMVNGFLVALILAGIAAAMAKPLQSWIMGVTGGRSALASTVTIIIIGLAVIAPLLGVIWIAASQAEGLTAGAEGLVKQLGTISPDDPLPEWVPFGEQIGKHSAAIMAKLGEFTSAAGGFFVSVLTEMTLGTVNFFLDLFIFFYALFCFLQMKTPVIDQILSYTGLPDATQRTLADRMVSISRATIKGTLLIGVAQGTLGGLGFWAVGLEGAAFWGVVMAVLSIIPGLGPLFIIFCGVVWLFAQGESGSAIGLAVWGFGVVGTIDNLLRPILVGRDAAMADIMILISTLGGLVVFGASGLVLGPVLAGLFVTLWDTVRDASRNGLSQAATAVEIDTAAAGGETATGQAAPTDILDDELAQELEELHRLKSEIEARHRIGDAEA